MNSHIIGNGVVQTIVYVGHVHICMVGRGSVPSYLPPQAASTFVSLSMDYILMRFDAQEFFMIYMQIYANRQPVEVGGLEVVPS
jgi:hypothetical protein